MRLLYLSFLITLITSSCGTTQEVKPPIQEAQIPEADLPSQIVFLYFDIEKDIGKKVEIKLTKTQIVNGQLKENTIINAPRKEGNLILQILDNQNKVIEEQIIEDPLNKNMEQYNESGKANTHTVKLQKSQFYMRFNQQSSSKYIKILKIGSSGDIEIHLEQIHQ